MFLLERPEEIESPTSNLRTVSQFSDISKPTLNNSCESSKEKRRIAPPSLKGKLASLHNPGVPRALRMIPTGPAVPRLADKKFLHGSKVVKVVGPVSTMTACPVCQGKCPGMVWKVEVKYNTTN